MKIAILTDILGGGTGTHLLSMLKHWDRGRYETVIFSTAPKEDRFIPEGPVEYIPPVNGFNFYPAAQIRRLARLRRIMKEFRPDIVHAYFFWSIIYGRLLKLAGTVDILVENREDQGFNWGRHEYLWLRNTYRLADRIVCVSEAVKQAVVEKEGVEPSRIEVVNNGIDIQQGSSGEPEAIRRELGFDPGHLVLGMVANYNRPVKGVGNFLDAIPAIVKEMPSARFLFVGGGDEENSLRDKARALGIEPYVVFAGFKKDIRPYYEIMDISVLTSFSEGLSLTLLESMVYGIPIVATRVGGNPEVVEEGVNGYLVPVKDTPALVDRIVKLLKDPDLRHRMGREGRLRAERNFQIRGVANRYLELYNRLKPASQ
ncbi:MAG: glycosyltransferase family 4 protein [Deltaproteobacteria bacterium]|nr:glycosyltransferase family 4 protein [Deltaproteobacteria bacterium]